MRKAICNKVKENLSNFNNLIGIAQTAATGKMNLGFPVPEQYPPTFVLKPQKQFPFLKPMRGSDYYNELQRKRRG